MIHIRPERLVDVVASVFGGAGAPESSARQVAESLVENNLAGHESHGVLRVGYYVRCILDGTLDPFGEIVTVRESAATALLDGGRNFGQICATKAMDTAIEKARAHDVGIVTMRNCHHTGRMGEYVVRAARQGFVGMVYGSGSRPGGSVAPFGGISRVFNTNPISWGFPAKDHEPVFLDCATSACAQGKLQAAQDKGVPIPEGWLVTADGTPTTDPSEQRNGGVMMPFGLHKGSGLSFLIEAMNAGLTGTHPAPHPEYERGYTLVMTAINIEAFQPLDEFCQVVSDVIAATKAATPAEGVDEVLVPGEPEWLSREKGMAEGLHIPDACWQRIVDAGQSAGVFVEP